MMSVASWNPHGKFFQPHWFFLLLEITTDFTFCFLGTSQNGGHVGSNCWNPGQKWDLAKIMRASDNLTYTGMMCSVSTICNTWNHLSFPPQKILTGKKGLSVQNDIAFGATELREKYPTPCTGWETRQRTEGRIFWNNPTLMTCVSM